jgi:hypothetical protein
VCPKKAQSIFEVFEVKGLLRVILGLKNRSIRENLDKSIKFVEFLVIRIIRH